MTFTEYGRSGTALLFAGSGNVPRYLAIGSGSGAGALTAGSLVAEVQSSRTAFSTRDIGTSKQCTFVFDLNSIQMSGVFLKEFGVGGVPTKATNDLWIHEVLPSITFDGTNELEVQVTFQTF